MARKTALHTVTDAGRDKGKKFLITEMSSRRGEEWALRALLAIGGSVDLPEGFESLGMAGLAELGLRAITNLKFEIAKPLLDEMMTCVQIYPDPNKLQNVRAILEEEDGGEDIEEIKTRFDLRVEFWNLHMGFLNAAVTSLKVKEPAAHHLSHTPTSQE